MNCYMVVVTFVHVDHHYSWIEASLMYLVNGYLPHRQQLHYYYWAHLYYQLLIVVAVVVAADLAVVMMNSSLNMVYRL